jgi:hypothetical protein
MKPPLLFRLAFGSVWLVNGVWCKLLDGVQRHREIVARILGDDHSLVLTRLIGAGEVLVAVWILTGIRWKWSCAFQILLVATMNAIEFLLVPDLLLFGRLNSLVALAYCALEALTIPVSELVKADHGASQDKPSEVNIGAALIADAQTPEVF